TSVDIQTVFEKGTIDEWLPLEVVKKGMVHIKATWLYLANDPLELDRIVGQVRDTSDDEDSVHSALLLVYVDSAVDLPRAKKTLMEPSPQVYLTVGQHTEESTVRANTCEPRWETNFRFFVVNPNHQNLDVEIRDCKTKKTLGETTVRLKELMQSEDMVMDQKFRLKGGEPSTAIYMTLVLRAAVNSVRTCPITESIGWAVSAGRFGILFVTSAEGSSVDANAGSKAAGEPAASQPNGGGTAPAGQGDQGRAPPREEIIKPASSPPPTESEVRQRKPGSTTPSAGSIDDDGLADGKQFPFTSVEDRGEHGLGRIQLTFRYSLQRQRLMVVIHKISNLKPAEGDSKGLADPYVKLYLLPDRDSKSKRKTDVVKDNLNPVYDTTFDYPVSMAELNSRSLELTVKNETGMFSSSQSLLGMVLIDLSTLDTSRAVTQ
ncbi:hypothetical protein BaRGS_00022935, partial [Batillaria attramentaria]